MNVNGPTSNQVTPANNVPQAGVARGQANAAPTTRPNPPVTQYDRLENALNNIMSIDVEDAFAMPTLLRNLAMRRQIDLSDSAVFISLVILYDNHRAPCSLLGADSRVQVSIIDVSASYLKIHPQNSLTVLCVF